MRASSIVITMAIARSLIFISTTGGFCGSVGFNGHRLGLWCCDRLCSWKPDTSVFVK